MEVQGNGHWMEDKRGGELLQRYTGRKIIRVFTMTSVGVGDNVTFRDWKKRSEGLFLWALRGRTSKIRGIVCDFAAVP